MTEDQEQAEFVKWYARTYPHLLPALRFSMTAVTATLGSKKGAILKNRMKSLGVQFGEADIAILLPKNGFGCMVDEHKAEGSSWTLQPAQKEYLDFHNSIGNYAIQTRGLDELKQAVRRYIDGPE